VPNLFVIRGRDQGTRYEIDQQAVSIGRDPSNVIQLHDTEISRNHARFQLMETKYTLFDLQSSNGTYVNGKPIQEHILLSGDQIQMGRTLLLYTGFADAPLENIDELVDIVSLRQSNDDSRIVRSITQEESNAIWEFGGDDARTPWLARARSNLQIMYRTALAVSHTLDIDQLLSRIMDMIFEWVEADRGCIMLKQPETGKLEPKVRRHRGGSNQQQRMTISKTILDYVVDRNEGVLTSNARDDDRWNPAQSILQMGVREAICVPMQGRYDVVGVIYIDTHTSPQQIIQQQQARNKFSDQHLKLMIAIAHQAALAVEDTSYYKAMVQAERLAAVGQTIATLSHHIKNILQGIRGGSYLIEMGLGDYESASQLENADPTPLHKSLETIRKGWDIVEKNQHRISTLVLDMLTFSKDREPQPEPSDLNAIVADVVELMTTHAAESHVDLQWNPADDFPTLMFDPEGLHRAVLNVVTNAIDACDGREGGRVIVSTGHGGEPPQARVVIQDNGSGISRDDIEKVFTIFVSKKGGRGTGLGLPVSQKILKEHGGRIHVESKVGEGSVFTLEFPAARPQIEERNTLVTRHEPEA
jgi:signal transduction histidine kinase